MLNRIGASPEFGLFSYEARYNWLSSLSQRSAGETRLSSLETRLISFITLVFWDLWTLSFVEFLINSTYDYVVRLSWTALPGNFYFFLSLLVHPFCLVSIVLLFYLRNSTSFCNGSSRKSASCFGYQLISICYCIL